MKRLLAIFVWGGLALLGAGAYAGLALKRHEPINSAYLLVAALCTYAIGYRFYSKWIIAKALAVNDRRATPCELHDDGKDFVRTNPWIVFGHHFAAISGPGPLVGPVLAAQFGFLPGTLWILIGCVLGGAVQDLVLLFCSLRRDGKSLGQMVKEELNSAAGLVSLVAILAIMIILLAVLGLVVAKALAESPWGVFTVGATIPIAMFMGGYLRWWRVGKVLEASVFGVALLLLAVWGGQYVHGDPHWRLVFKLKEEPLAWAIIAYGLAASILPVWLLLAPRDYLSTFMKLGTIFALAVGVFFLLPDLKMPALTSFIDGSGMVVAGKLFPFCFITIACGAISGFHSLISSGTTPKLVTRERYVRPIGYGAMCLESLVAIMAMVAACTLEPGVYLSMNTKGVGTTPAEVAVDTARKVNAAGYAVTVEEMETLAKQMGEDTLFGRTGGAATLAVGMANIFSRVVGGRGLDLWYHFAIMFEALFILTTLDAGTRVGRYILQDALGNAWPSLRQTRNLAGNLLASVLMVSGWGYFLIQGVRDPLGGINSLWPLFGIANQLLAAIALCLATTILLKMHLAPGKGCAGDTPPVPAPRPWIAAFTLVPLVWLLAVTLTAGWQKINHSDPRIGFLANASALQAKLPALQEALTKAEGSGDAALLKKAQKDLHANRALHFNNRLDAVVAGIFLVLVSLIVVLSVREWFLLLSRRRAALVCETPPVWLPDYAMAQPKSGSWWGTFALLLGLARELTSEATYERARHQESTTCQCGHDHSSRTDGQLYADVTKERYRSIRRCC
jgi:carbon starvation protein